MKACFISLALVLTACGTDDSVPEQGATDPTTALATEERIGAKGDKGDTGAQGPKGDKGDAGNNGIDGSDGLNGADGKDGKPTTANQWFDPITEHVWLIGGKVTAANRVCGNGYEVPSFEALLDAHAHGIFGVADVVAAAAWTKEDVAPYIRIVRDTGLEGSATPVATPNERHYLFCVSLQTVND